MAIDELFQSPTVKTVIFQIRYPNLFYLENRIGEFQLRIMKQFPESALGYRRQLVFADLGPKAKLEDVPFETSEEEGARKIWHFESRQGYELNVLSNSLDITSNLHKTYNHPEGAHKFRDVIEHVSQEFFSVMQIPIVSRVGLRYVDVCPIPDKENSAFKQLYNTSFPLDRFSLSDCSEMEFRALATRGDYSLRFMESLIQKEAGQFALILDFDAFTTDIEPDQIMHHTDGLHDLISQEYDASITEALKEIMRQPREENHEIRRS